MWTFNSVHVRSAKNGCEQTSNSAHVHVQPRHVINSAVLYQMYMFTVYINLHHSGTQFFLEKCLHFFDPKIRQLLSPGGQAMSSQNFSLY